MNAKLIGCAVDCGETFLDAESHETHLTDIHHTTYELATGSELTMDECEALGIDPMEFQWRNSRPVSLEDLTVIEQIALYEFRKGNG